MIEVIECGTIATTKLHEIKGMITACSIRFDKINYEFTYFKDGEQRVIWLHEEEFEKSDHKKINIGFKAW